jgi:hypothetical protein
MGTEADFHTLELNEQNQLLQMVAALLRPAIGEIGEVVVKEKEFVVDGVKVKKKPGFLGLLFRHADEQVIAFAEFVHEDDRKKYREQMPIAASHVLAKNLPFVVPIVEAAGKSSSNSLGDSDSLKLVEMNDAELTRIFRIAYGVEADGADFKIKLLAKTLHTNSANQWESLLYFAVKDDGHGLSISSDLLDSLARLVEQLVRNALGLAGISDQRLRSTVGHLLSKLSQKFNDYIYPQTLAAIYAYVREVVPLPLTPSDTEPCKAPLVSGCGENFDGAKLANRMKALHHAKEVKVNRAVGGSLKGASVYSLTVKTVTHGSDEETSYPAIAKFSTIKEARDESEGLRKLQRYYSRIGKMLPPPLEVYLERNPTTGIAELDRKDWLKTPCISLTPDLEGAVLSEKITEHWASPTRRVERFSGFLSQAQKFISEIQAQPIEHTTADGGVEEYSSRTLVEFFTGKHGIKQNPAEKHRYQVLTTSLGFPPSAWLRVKISADSVSELVVPNPIRWIGMMLSDDEFRGWGKDLVKRKSASVLVHGDFHTGNLFLSRDTDQLTVLDYDRVGSGPPEEDFARLDASFVSFVFALRDFRDGINWQQFAPDALALAAGLHPKTVVTLERNSFARDLVEVLEVIRPDGLSQFFCASVAKALLIQLKTSCTKWNEGRYVLADEKVLRDNQGRNGATWLYLAFMLSRLLEPMGTNETAEPEPWMPFDSAIKKKA